MNKILITEFINQNSLDNLKILHQHPVIIIQGRYDIICPIQTADLIAESWPNSDYRIVMDAGHSSLETGIRSTLIQATNEFRYLE